MHSNLCHGKARREILQQQQITEAFFKKLIASIRFSHISIHHWLLKFMCLSFALNSEKHEFLVKLLNKSWMFLYFFFLKNFWMALNIMQCRDCTFMWGSLFFCLKKKTCFQTDFCNSFFFFGHGRIFSSFFNFCSKFCTNHLF